MKKVVLMSMLSASLLVSSMAMADPYDGGPQGDDPPQQAYDHPHHPQEGDSPRPSADWQRGQPMPARYNDGRYAVNDWQQRGLPAPPRGHHWMYINGEYVLSAIATGVISAILMGAIYGPGGGR